MLTFQDLRSHISPNLNHTFLSVSMTTCENKIMPIIVENWDHAFVQEHKHVVFGDKDKMICHVWIWKLLYLVAKLDYYFNIQSTEKYSLAMC